MEVVNKVQDAGISLLLHRSSGGSLTVTTLPLRSGLAPLSQQWDSSWPRASRDSFLSSLLVHCTGGSQTAKELLEALVTLASGHQELEVREQQEIARGLLEELLRGLLDILLSPEEPAQQQPILHLGWLGLPSLPQEAR